MYPPVRQFEQYDFTTYLQQMSRRETAPADSPVSPSQRAWLAAAALLVLVAVVASYGVAATASLHL